MQLRPSLEAGSHSDTEELPNILLNPKVQYRVHNGPPVVPTVTQTNPVYNTLTNISKIHLMLSSHLRLCFPSGVFLSDFPTKSLYVFVFSPCVLHALAEFLAFHVPNHMFIFRCLCRSKEPDQVRGLVKHFTTMLFLLW